MKNKSTKKVIGVFSICLFALIFLFSCNSNNNATPIEDDGSAKDITYYFDLGNKCLSEGRNKDAIENFNKAIELNHDIAELYVQRGLAKSQLEEYRDAIIDIETALKLSPTNLSIINVKGDIEFNGELYDKALEDYNFVIKKDSTFRGIYFSRGLVKIKMGLKKEACEDFYMAKLHGDTQADNLIKENCK